MQDVLAYKGFNIKEINIEDDKSRQEYAKIKMDPYIIIEDEKFIEGRDIYDSEGNAIDRKPSSIIISYYIKGDW